MRVLWKGLAPPPVNPGTFPLPARVVVENGVVHCEIYPADQWEEVTRSAHEAAILAAAVIELAGRAGGEP